MSSHFSRVCRQNASPRRRPLFESLENRSLLASVPWNEVAEIETPTGTSGAGSAGEWRTVAMEGDTIVVSSRNDDQAAVDAGAAYVYQRDDNGTPGDVGDDKWALAQTLFGSGTSPQSSDLQTGDFFGDSVAINGEWMIIGAGHPTTLCCPTPALGDGLGVAYVYRQVDGVWQYQQTLEPVDRGGIDDGFGRFWKIAIEGNLAAVSAGSDDNANGVDAGAVHVYRFDGNSWVHDAKLFSSESGPSHFGTSVAVKGGEVIVGSNAADGAVPQSGAVYVFSEVGGQWQETAKLFASDGQALDAFGNQVAREGNTIAVGADEADAGGNRSGAVWIFELSGGIWTQTAKLLSSDLEADDHFGRQVNLNNGTLLVGNWYGDGVIPDSGAVYAFERVAGQWTEVDKLFESDRTSGGIGTTSFGSVLDFGSSGEVVIGGEKAGVAYVFAQDATRITTAYRNTTPQTIADRRGKTSGVTTSTINVTDAGTILDLDVRLDITHPNDNDLSVVLVSPSGTQIPLFAQVGGTGDNFTTTVLDSQASAPIASGTAPFTGRFRPTGNLSSLTGTNLQGTWKVVITDSAVGSTGTLQGWSLRAKYQPPAPQISISDATATEGSSALKILDRFVQANSGGLQRPRTPLFGPDANGDGAQDLYVVSADTDKILLYDGQTGAFLRTFVEDSGRLVNPGDIAFGTDGNLYVSSIGTPTGLPPVAGSGSVLRYDGTTGSFVDQIASGLSQPLGLTFGPDGSLYITNQGTNDVLRYNSSGLSVFVPPGSGSLSSARNAIFGPDGNLYVSSSNTDSILRYSGTSGAFLNVFAITPDGDGGPAWIQFGPDGNLYATAHSAATCCNTTLYRIHGSTGAHMDSFDLNRDGWSFRFGPDGLIYNSSNGQGIFDAEDDSYLERIGPSSLAAFTVSLSAPSAFPVTVEYATGGGSAGADDFNGISGTITFAPGETSRTILVQTNDDVLIEGNETFVVNLTNPSGAVLADSQGVGTIIDNDLPPSVDVVASGETSTFGTVAAGDNHQDTWLADGNVETLTEEKYSGNKRSRLEHSWRFDGVTSGDTIELIVAATHLNANPVETFSFAFSTNGTSWTTLGVLADAPYTLPSNLSGTVYIRVTDTDRNNEAALDALAVDQLLIRTTTAGATSTSAAATSSTSETSAETDAALLMWLTEDSLTTTRRK